MVKLLTYIRTPGLISIHTPSVRKVPGAQLGRHTLNLSRIAHHPDALHPHDHVLQRMAVDHPHTGVGDAEPPGTPARSCSRRGACSVAVEHGGISLDGLSWMGGVEVEVGLDGFGVVGPVAAAQVEVVLAVGVKRVDIDAAVGVDLGACVLQDNLQDLTHLGRERLGAGVPPLVRRGDGEIGDGGGATLVDVHEQRDGVGDVLVPGEAVEGPDCLVRGRGDELGGVDCDTAGYF